MEVNIPIARSRARQRRSGSAMRAYWSYVAVSSRAAALDEFFAERVPDVLEQFRIAWGFAHLHGIARPRNVHFEHILDLAWSRRKQDNAVSQRQGLTEVV